ncbi:MAG: hypothetical protein EHM23_05680 [Acidobacteria bacterium]|nr:MAG: hypothetical protein EHM23_05680 [Acidobacteriota bacterium]
MAGRVRSGIREPGGFGGRLKPLPGTPARVIYTRENLDYHLTSIRFFLRPAEIVQRAGSSIRFCFFSPD